MPTDRMMIDEETLLPVVIRARLRLLCDPEKWNDYEIEQIRHACGVAWASMPLVNVRLQCCGLRKAGKLPKVRKDKNHGATKREHPPEDYIAYLLTPHWKEFRLRVLEWWDYKCAICNSQKKLDVHHRTYIRMGCEELQDCIALCRRCHTMADRARKREKQTEQAEEMAKQVLIPF